MKLYHYKPLDLGFVILCPDNDMAEVRLTANSIRRRYNCPVVVAVSECVSDVTFEEIGKICPAYRGADTITSLLNAGLDHCPAPWNITVMAGTWVRHNLDKKYSYFVERESDILYAIVDGYCEFSECSLNGIMIHREMWNKIGHFDPKDSLPMCKLMWAQNAIDKGAQIKGVIGVKMI